MLQGFGRMSRLLFLEFLRKSKVRTLRTRLLASGAIGYVSAGFLYANWLCQTCQSTDSYPLQVRLVIGFWASMFSIIYFGFPPDAVGHVNLWPYIIGVAALVFVLWMVVAYLCASLTHNQNTIRPD